MKFHEVALCLYLLTFSVNYCHYNGYNENNNNYQPKSIHRRIRRWRNLRQEELARGPTATVSPLFIIRPTKVFCENATSPVALGGQITIHRRKGETHESALIRRVSSDEEGEDESILNPKIQILRFNKRYPKIRDLLFFQNDGEKVTFQFMDKDTSDATIRGENWDDEYVFAKGHFLWTQAKDFLHKVGGAGHRINDILYPVEMELIHYRSSDESLAAAWTKGGVVILSIVMRLRSRGVPALTPLLSSFPIVAQPGPRKLLHAPVNFSQLLPAGDSYFEYIGSYTYTPCHARVRRIVFQTPIDIDHNQLSYFEYLVYDDKKFMSNNFSPVRPLRGRPVTYYEGNYVVSTRIKLSNKEKPSRKRGDLVKENIVSLGT